MAGDESYILKVRVASPIALEELLNQIRTAANVSTRTTVVLSTPYEHRTPEPAGEDGGGARGARLTVSGTVPGRPRGPAR
ncbi:Lrp/AsnC ligand binding domain-containing protein [Streptosporangium vulgare]|uniref:Lrp/AsnC ligand binding domain-containing protein n=1 Tax=Streptosporangium vulgare TaxID=46190 RepID=UPI0033779962